MRERERNGVPSGTMRNAEMTRRNVSGMFLESGRTRLPDDGAHPGRVAERVAEIRAVAYRSIFSLGREKRLPTPCPTAADVARTDSRRGPTPSGKRSAVHDVRVPAEVTRRVPSVAD